MLIYFKNYQDMSHNNFLLISLYNTAMIRNDHRT
jgi:hypothetical protein